MSNSLLKNSLLFSPRLKHVCVTMNWTQDIWYGFYALIMYKCSKRRGGFVSPMIVHHYINHFPLCWDQYCSVTKVSLKKSVSFGVVLAHRMLQWRYCRDLTEEPRCSQNLANATKYGEGRRWTVHWAGTKRPPAATEFEVANSWQCAADCPNIGTTKNGFVGRYPPNDQWKTSRDGPTNPQMFKSSCNMRPSVSLPARR